MHCDLLGTSWIKNSWRLIVPILSLIFATSTLSFSQKSDLKWVELQKTDSCQLSIYRVTTKEMTKLGQEPEEILLKTITLSRNDMDRLLKKLSKKSSYSDSRTLLTHHNLAFNFFNRDKVISKVVVSTLTGNVSIHDFTHNQTTHKGVSKKFGDYLLSLLDNNKVISLIPKYKLQGLNSEYDN